MIQSKRFVMDKSMRLTFAFLKVNEVSILQKAEIPLDFFNRRVLSLSGEEYFRLWNALMEEASLEIPIPLMLDKIPLHAAINVPIMAALCAPDFVTSAERIKELKPLIGPLILDLTETGETYEVNIMSAVPEIELHPMVVAIETMFFVKMIRYATGKPVIPRSVETMELLTEKAYEEYFGVKPVTGSVNRVVFALEDARLPFEMENEAVWQQLNHSRELLSRHYLRNSELSIMEIAFLLGFEEHSSFSRAFHIWTGNSPEAFRSAA